MRSLISFVFILLVISVTSAQLPPPYLPQDILLYPTGYQADMYSYQLGRDVDFQVDTIVASGYQPGQGGVVFVFKQNNLNWVEVQRVFAPVGVNSLSDFGSSVALRKPWLVVGAESVNRTFQLEGAVYIYKEQPDGSFAYHSELVAADLFPLTLAARYGEQLEINDDGNRIVIGVPDLNVDVNGDATADSQTGGIYEFVYDAQNDQWTPAHFYSSALVTNSPLDKHFGLDVGISGSTIVAGWMASAVNGHTHKTFVLEGGAVKFDISNVFARSVDINESWLVLGRENGAWVYTYDDVSATKVYGRDFEFYRTGEWTDVSLDGDSLAISTAKYFGNTDAEGAVEIWKAVSGVWEPIAYYRGAAPTEVRGLCCLNVALSDGRVVYGDPTITENETDLHGVIYFHWGNGARISIGNDVTFVETDTDTQVTIPVSLDKPHDKTVTFAVAATDRNAKAGQDYILETTSGTIPIGETSVDLTVTIVGDNRIESSLEFFELTITEFDNVNPYDLNSHFRITDDDPIIVPNAGFEAGSSPWTLTKKVGTPSNDKFTTAVGLGAHNSDNFVLFKANVNEKTILKQTITDLPIFPVEGGTIRWGFFYRAIKSFAGTAKLTIFYADGTKQNLTLKANMIPTSKTWQENGFSSGLRSPNVVSMQITFTHINTLKGSRFEVDDIFIEFDNIAELDSNVLPLPSRP